MLDLSSPKTAHNDMVDASLEERLRQAEALVKFNQLLTTTIDVPEIYRRTSRLMAEELGCSRSLISILEVHGESLLVEIEFVLTAETSGKFTIQPKQFILDHYPTFQQVLATQKAIFQSADDDDLTDQESAYLAEIGQAHGLLLPIVQDGRSRGLIHLYRSAKHPPFGKNSQNMAQTMAIQLGFTLRNALYASEARARAAQLSTVNRINTLLSVAPSLREVLVGARREIFSLVEATGMSIVLLDEEAQKFNWLYAYEHGQEVDLSQIPLLPLTRGFSGQVYQRREVVVFNKEVDQKRQEFASIVVGAPPSVWAGFPLVVANKFVGVLAIENEFDSYAFSEYDLQLLETISSPIAIAINNLLQFEQVQQALIIQSEQRLQLQTAAEVAAAASSIRDSEELMQRTVNLIQERFALYYVGLFLIDEKSNQAVLKAGTGKSGRLQIQRGHRLRIGGRSLIGGATYDGQPRIIQNVATAKEWLPNPLLPGTHSELALPLQVRGRIIGALTVQSATADAFAPTLISTLQTMSDQLAVAIENAQLLQTAQRYSNQLSVAAEVSRAATTILERDRLITEVVELIRSRFDLYYVGLFLTDQEEQLAVLQAGTGEAGRVQVEQGHHLPLDGQSMVGQAITTNHFQVSQDVATATNFKPNPLLPDTRSEAALPLRVRDRIIGALTVQSSQLDAFTIEAITVLQSLTDQLAISIDNAGLFAQIETNLEETSDLYEASRRLSEAPDQDSTYQALINFAQMRNLCDVVHIVNQPEAEVDRNIFIVTAKYWSRPGIVYDPPERFEMSQLAPYDHPAETTQKFIIFADSQNEPSLSDELRHLLRTNDITRTPLLPIVTEGQWLGTIILHRLGEARPFTENELKALRTLADQSATILANQRLFAEIQAANEKLRQLDQLKTQFLANMSHELRTPLNSIIGFSRVILKGIDGPITQEQEEDLNSIHNNGQHLLMLINEILDMAKIEAGKMMLAFEEVDLAETSYGAITAVRNIVEEKGVTLRAEIANNLPTIDADPVRLKQILINLLSNAAKYTEKGQIDLLVRPDGDDHVRIAVKDTGIGIAPEDHETLFRPFEQVDSSPTRVAGGTGLGLPLTKWMVTMHHGEIWFDSQIGKGTTFYVRLPLQQPERAPDQNVLTFINSPH
jgi:signal transduction histidine kinase/putative methionine-R-sulfoxide reductase with GAF domain